MADTKISDLPSETILVGDEVLPMVQSGVTEKTTLQEVADLASGALLYLHANFI